MRINKYFSGLRKWGDVESFQKDDEVEIHFTCNKGTIEIYCYGNNIGIAVAMPKRCDYLDSDFFSERQKEQIADVLHYGYSVEYKCAAIEKIIINTLRDR